MNCMAITLWPHSIQSMNSNASFSTRRACVLQNLALLRFQHAWRSAVMLDERMLYVALGNRALEAMDTQTALNVYRQLGDAGMVMSLEMIEDIEDKNLLAGHISQLFGNFAKAQQLFWESSTPKAALTMRRNLLQVSACHRWFVIHMYISRCLTFTITLFTLFFIYLTAHPPCDTVGPGTQPCQRTRSAVLCRNKCRIRASA